MLEHVCHNIVERLEEFQHFLHLTVQQRFIDLGEVASLHRIERCRLLDVGPELL